MPMCRGAYGLVQPPLGWDWELGPSRWVGFEFSGREPAARPKYKSVIGGK